MKYIFKLIDKIYYFFINIIFYKWPYKIVLLLIGLFVLPAPIQPMCDIGCGQGYLNLISIFFLFSGMGVVITALISLALLYFVISLFFMFYKYIKDKKDGEENKASNQQFSPASLFIKKHWLKIIIILSIIVFVPPAIDKLFGNNNLYISYKISICAYGKNDKSGIVVRTNIPGISNIEERPKDSCYFDYIDKHERIIDKKYCEQIFSSYYKNLCRQRIAFHLKDPLLCNINFLGEQSNVNGCFNVLARELKDISLCQGSGQPDICNKMYNK